MFIISTSAPQPGLQDKQKDQFYDIIFQPTSVINNSDHIFIAGDFNGHAGQHPSGFLGVHEGCGISSYSEGETKLFTFYNANNNDLRYILEESSKSPVHCLFLRELKLN